MNRLEYAAELKRRGYTEVGERSKPAGAVDERHTHEFDAYLLMLDGEYTLVYDDGPRTYRPGDVIDVPRGTPHAEQVGATEIRYLVGRRD